MNISFSKLATSMTFGGIWPTAASQGVPSAEIFPFSWQQSPWELLSAWSKCGKGGKGEWMGEWMEGGMDG